MTNLDRRPVTRETMTIDDTRGGRRLLVVRLEVGGKIIRIRPKGTYKWFSVDYATVYRLAVKAYAAEILARRKAERAERRKQRTGR